MAQSAHNRYALGVDIGGSHVCSAVVDLATGQLCGEPHTDKVDAAAGARTIAGAWAANIRRTAAASGIGCIRCAGFAFPGPFDYERGISLGVLSKAYGLPGLRVGWLACKDAELMEGIARYKNYLSICGATPSEALALVALRHGPELLEKNRRIIAENLQTADAFFARHAQLFTYNRPQAGPIGFSRIQVCEPMNDFCERLAHEAGVLLLPGSVYGIKEPYFRMGYGRKTFAAHLAKFEEWLVSKRLV